MKILYMDWMSKFRCIGGACPLTCCTADWRIALTDQEIANYDNMKHPFAKEIASMIDRKNKCMKTRNGVCEALTEDGWCRLVQECGEKSLSATCTHFPKTIKEYGDVKEGTVEITCPVVAGYLLTPEMIEFEFAEEQMDRLTKEIDYQVYDSLSLARTYLIGLVQMYPGHFFSGKLYIIFQVLYQMQDLCKEGKLDREAVQKLLHPYEYEGDCNEILTKCEALNKQYEMKGILLQRLLTQLKPLLNQENLLSGLPDQYNYLEQELGLWLTDPKRLAEDMERFQQYRNREYPYMVDQFLVYILFLDWISMDLEKFGSVIHIRMLEFTLMQIVAMSLWKQRGKIDKEVYEVIIASIDRVISHQNTFRGKLYQIMKLLGKDDVANIIFIQI